MGIQDKFIYTYKGLTQKEKSQFNIFVVAVHYHFL